MKNRATICVIVLNLFVVNSCDNVTTNFDKRDKLCFPDIKDQNLFLTTLNNSDIEYEYNGNQGCFYYDSKFRENVTILQTETFGESPPAGLSISMGK